MRTYRLAIAVALVAAVTPVTPNAWVVVRGPVFVAPAPVVVVAPVAVAPVPVVVAPAPVVPAPIPAPPPPLAPPLTTALPINTTMWVLPSGCLRVSVNGQPLYQCGPNWLRQLPSAQGPYYAVVPPP